jgi:hypothetical protein
MGRVLTPSGQGLRGSVVSTTDTAGIRRSVVTSTSGYYSFDEIPAGQTVTLAVASRRYRFQSTTLTVNESLSNVDFVGIE